jgi:hypothetical protein
MDDCSNVEISSRTSGELLDLPRQIWVRGPNSVVSNRAKVFAMWASHAS